MSTEKKDIVLVCIANFCRSPVAEILLRERFGSEKYNFISAGIHPIKNIGMDDRSSKFLKSLDVNLDYLHMPKKINYQIIKNAKHIFGMDHLCMKILNADFSSEISKIRLFSYQNKDISIIDPYKLSDKEYEKVMNDIYHVVQGFSI
tara:strand:+ start:27 stop:467 length:441 start_codon:yes stop_codon:yes gene_type:complete